MSPVAYVGPSFLSAEEAAALLNMELDEFLAGPARLPHINVAAQGDEPDLRWHRNRLVRWAAGEYDE